MRSLLPFLSMASLSLYALFTWASNEDLDSLGCFTEPATGHYQCVEGPLKGREFLSREEADLSLEKEPKEQSPAPLKIISWDISNIGNKKFEYDRVAIVLAEADFSILQGVEFSATGETALTVIADLMARRLKQRVCKAWFKSANGAERGRHAFLWIDSSIKYIDKGGEVADRCPDAPVVIRTSKNKIEANSVFEADFYFKEKDQFFHAASLQAIKRNEISASFSSLGHQSWPVIFVSDFKTSNGDKGLGSAAEKYGFKAQARRRGFTLWSKSLNGIIGRSLDLKEKFPELSSRDVKSMISSRSPLYAEFSFSAAEAKKLRTRLVHKGAEKPQPQNSTEEKENIQIPMSLDEDIEKEVGD